jgi:methionine biosynthesis protein MetW
MMPRDTGDGAPGAHPAGARGPGGSPRLRRDLQAIADMVEPKSRVLDVGCGEGELLDYLWQTKGADARGIELSMDGVHALVSRGLSVIQGDADTDLADYPDNAFDFVILSQTLQAVYRPDRVLANLVRIARRAIVSFPNFGHWRVRLALLLTGRMPVTEGLPYAWYDTPNIHLCTVTDLVRLCEGMGVAIERSVMMRGGRPVRMAPTSYANWMAEEAIFLLRRKGNDGAAGAG